MRLEIWTYCAYGPEVTNNETECNIHSRQCTRSAVRLVELISQQIALHCIALLHMIRISSHQLGV